MEKNTVSKTFKKRSDDNASENNQTKNYFVTKSTQVSRNIQAVCYSWTHGIEEASI
jgi:hypothetical protein